MSVRDIPNPASHASVSKRDKKSTNINTFLENWCKASEACLKQYVLQMKLKEKKKPCNTGSKGQDNLPTPAKKLGIVNTSTAEKAAEALVKPPTPGRNLEPPKPLPLEKTPRVAANLPKEETDALLEYAEVLRKMQRKVEKWVESKTTGDQPLPEIKTVQEAGKTDLQKIQEEVEEKYLLQFPVVVVLDSSETDVRLKEELEDAAKIRKAQLIGRCPVCEEKIGGLNAGDLNEQMSMHTYREHPEVHSPMEEGQIHKTIRPLVSPTDQRRALEETLYQLLLKDVSSMEDWLRDAQAHNKVHDPDQCPFCPAKITKSSTKKRAALAFTHATLEHFQKVQNISITAKGKPLKVWQLHRSLRNKVNEKLFMRSARLRIKEDEVICISSDVAVKRKLPEKSSHGKQKKRRLMQRDDEPDTKVFKHPNACHFFSTLVRARSFSDIASVASSSGDFSNPKEGTVHGLAPKSLGQGSSSNLQDEKCSEDIGGYSNNETKPIIESILPHSNPPAEGKERRVESIIGSWEINPVPNLNDSLRAYCRQYKPEGPVFECKYESCKKYLPSERLLRVHMIVAHYRRVEQILCFHSDCRITATNYKDLKSHMKETHGKKFSTTLREDMRYANKLLNERYECPFRKCGFITKSLEALDEHTVTHNNCVPEKLKKSFNLATLIWSLLYCHRINHRQRLYELTEILIRGFCPACNDRIGGDEKKVLFHLTSHLDFGKDRAAFDESRWISL